jgi:L-rhamnose isomerase
VNTSFKEIENAYALAKKRYADYDVDTDVVMETLSKIPISIHCWQGDNVCGFENNKELTGGGIETTGNYPGKARTAEELRKDLSTAFRRIPGRHRLNLHASYLETNGKKVDRNAIRPEHFSGWIDWDAQYDQSTCICITGTA